MIIKSSQRAGHRELAIHLMKEQDIDGTTQVVRITGSRDLITGDNVFEALDDMALMAQASDRVQKDIYHVSISPSVAMTDEEWDLAWEVYEQEFSLTELAYIEVTHSKGDRPEHRHRAYERVHLQTGRAVPISHSYARNELVSRLIEYNFGHELVIGKHNRAVMNRLRQEGEHDIVAWMEAGHAHSCDRPCAKQNHQDVQQEKRTKVPTAQVVKDLTECFEQTDSGQAFEVALAERGYVLARGDRRDFVIIDWEGAVHSPRRRIGVKAKVLRDKWADLNPQHLPTVDDVVQTIEALKASRKLAASASEEDTTDSEESSATDSIVSAGFLSDGDKKADEALEQLLDEELETQALIAALEQELEAERLQEEVNYWQRQAEAELERTKPRPRATRAHQTGRGRNTNLLRKAPLSARQISSLQGSEAIAERQRRLLALSKPISPVGGKAWALQRLPSDWLTAAASTDLAAGQGDSVYLTDARGLLDYQTAWPERFKGKRDGKGLSSSSYRMADRWILERLARRGYRRQQACRILMQASPEVMNQRPSERLRYVRRMTEKVYQNHEQQLSAAQQLLQKREMAKNTTKAQQHQAQTSTNDRATGIHQQPLNKSSESPNPTSNIGKPRQPEPPKQDRAQDRARDRGLER